MPTVNAGGISIDFPDDMSDEEIQEAIESQDMTPLMQKLMDSVTVASPEESAAYFKQGDFRWGETLQGEDSPTGRPIIYINDGKYQEGGAGDNYRQKAVTGELLHLLKNVVPDRYESLINSSKNPDYQRWAKESYGHAQKEGETRTFDNWHKYSRFDQVIGGYLQAQDPDMPTMKNWSRDKLPFGESFKAELEKLRVDMGL